jgi:hypothetical protein
MSLMIDCRFSFALFTINCIYNDFSATCLNFSYFIYQNFIDLRLFYAFLRNYDTFESTGDGYFKPAFFNTASCKTGFLWLRVLLEKGVEFSKPIFWQVTWDFDLFRWCLFGLLVVGLAYVLR